ncbi:MAG: permease [Clostridiales bacterium]|jgi:uncharacterized membrane protein YraQ (UPF0718 family)|nr:permease [Clostridiales bacterium]
MSLPVFAIAGFLGSGKTSFLKSCFAKKDWSRLKILYIQMETGEEELGEFNNVETIVFSPRDLKNPERVGERIRDALAGKDFDEIWVEMNGMSPVSELMDVLKSKALASECELFKCIFMADAKSLEGLIGRTGSALPDQIANSDFSVARNAKNPEEAKRAKRVLRDINPSMTVIAANDFESLSKLLFKKARSPISDFLTAVVAIIAAYVVFAPLLQRMGLPAARAVSIFLGVVLQAVPFLVAGVLISSAIQVFVSREYIERRFPKKLAPGMAMAVFGGFLLPVCDCASIPIFRSLVRKGIPLPVAVAFMTSAPVINPVVILSTYYAFGSVSIVIQRVALGIICSVIIGLSFLFKPPKGYLTGGSYGSFGCSCGCYNAQTARTLKDKFSLFLIHSQTEFFSVGKYLIIGTFVSAILQSAGVASFAGVAGVAGSTAIMMIMAFLLSLCSSSDAVVARSFATAFPPQALMGFMVFGPMMDIKNAMMLSAGFSKRFIARLLVVCFVVSFVAVMAFQIF